MSLLPLNRTSDAPSAAREALPLYREVDWNFRENRPLWRNGSPVFVTGARAVLVWAWNALHTPRFAHDVFSRDYGPDFEGLIGRTYTEEVRASEAIRIVRETLLVNPYITDVTQISADLSGSVLHLTFRMNTVYGEVRIDDCDITV